MSSGGREACIISHISACTMVDTSMDEHEVLSPHNMELGRWRCCVCECGFLRMMSSLCSKPWRPLL